jgi:2-haloacid dehalogenase
VAGCRAGARIVQARGESARLLVQHKPRHTTEAGIGSAGFGGVFGHVLTTDTIQGCTPDARARQTGIHAFGLQGEEILFVAFAGWDAAGAKSFGHPPYWVDRLNLPAERPGVSPDGTGQNLDDLVNFVKVRQNRDARQAVAP